MPGIVIYGAHDFTSALLHDPLIDLSYEVHNKEILDHLPEGAFVPFPTIRSGR